MTIPSDGVFCVVNPNEELTYTIENIGFAINGAIHKTQMQWRDDTQWTSMPKTQYQALPQLALSQSDNVIEYRHGQVLSPTHLDDKWAQALVRVAACDI